MNEQGKGLGCGAIVKAADALHASFRKHRLVLFPRPSITGGDTQGLRSYTIAPTRLLERRAVLAWQMARTWREGKSEMQGEEEHPPKQPQFLKSALYHAHSYAPLDEALFSLESFILLGTVTSLLSELRSKIDVLYMYYRFVPQTYICRVFELPHHQSPLPCHTSCPSHLTCNPTNARPPLHFGLELGGPTPLISHACKHPPPLPLCKLVTHIPCHRYAEYQGKCLRKIHVHRRTRFKRDVTSMHFNGQTCVQREGAPGRTAHSTKTGKDLFSAGGMPALVILLASLSNCCKMAFQRC